MIKEKYLNNWQIYLMEFEDNTKTLFFNDDDIHRIRNYLINKYKDYKVNYFIDLKNRIENKLYWRKIKVNIK